MRGQLLLVSLNENERGSDECTSKYSKRATHKTLWCAGKFERFHFYLLLIRKNSHSVIFILRDRFYDLRMTVGHLTPKLLDIKVDNSSVNMANPGCIGSPKSG